MKREKKEGDKEKARDALEIEIGISRAFLLGILNSYDKDSKVDTKEIMRFGKADCGVVWTRQRLWKSVKLLVKLGFVGVEIEGRNSAGKMWITEEGRKLWVMWVERARSVVQKSGIGKGGAKVVKAAGSNGEEVVQGNGHHKRDYVVRSAEDRRMVQPDPVDENQLTEEEQERANAVVMWREEGKDFIGVARFIGPGDMVVKQAGETWVVFYAGGKEALSKDAFPDEVEDPEWKYDFGSVEEAKEAGEKWYGQWLRVKKGNEEAKYLHVMAIQP